MSTEMRDLELGRIATEVTAEDERIYREITSIKLSAEQKERIIVPSVIHPRQKSVLAIHWHPEFVPVEWIRQRVATTFPNRQEDLIIPTQHNVLTTYDGYTGVEVDCYSRGFDRKVQLLIHFADKNIQSKGHVFKSMLAHTFTYRTGQLFEFIESLIDPAFEARVDAAAEETGAGADLVEFVRIHVRRIKQLIERHESTTPPEMVRNKLLRDYFYLLRDQYNDHLINHVQVFLREVKQIVKDNFALAYFYRTEEIIEEARSLGAGIVIPHPEQFWPVLLADLDVDGIEVWNPQSFQYTDFLIHVVHRANGNGRRGRRPLLSTMGDDCHMGEKTKNPRYQDKVKARREIGYQPPWDDLNIRKSLIVAGLSRETVIREYKSRLG